MKKKLAITVMGVLMVTAMTGCGKKYISEEDFSQYVDLCDYKGVEATKVSYQVTDEDVQEQINEELNMNADYETITDRGVQKGDYVIVSYKASRNGEELQDYSGEEEEILVGEEMIYPEVDEALIGMNMNESKTVDVTLTEDFGGTEDAGEKLSVTVTVNDISIEILPEYNDEFVKENTDYKSKKEYEEALKKKLEDEKSKEYKSVTAEEILDYVVENSKFNGYSQSLYDECKKSYDDMNEYNAEMFNMTLDEYMDFAGITEEAIKQDVENMVNREMVMNMILQKEKIGYTSREVKNYAKEVYEEYEYDSADEFLEEYEEEDIGYEIAYWKLVDFLYDNAKYKEISEEEYLEQFSYDFDDEDMELNGEEIIPNDADIQLLDGDENIQLLDDDADTQLIDENDKNE